ncbi:MAG: DUF3786 domain-containing protein [Romboutsia sp.]
MGNNLNEGNYQFVLNHIIKKFANSDISTISKLSNSPYDPNNNYFKMKFLNNTLYIKHPTGEVIFEDGKTLYDVSMKILIIRFLVNANENTKETKKYISYKEIEGGYIYYPNFKERTISFFIKKYGNNLKLFEEQMKSIEATKLNLGDTSYKVRFINDTYIAFILWEGDDELQPSGNILFDSSVKSYFNAEDLAIIPDIILKNLN